MILTASSERQAQSYRHEIEQRRAQGSLPSGVPFLVVPDPLDRRVGSGGATLNALRAMAEQLAPGMLAKPAAEVDAWWAQQKILMIHSGGDSRRLPQYSLSGKLFSALPVRSPWGGASTVFDETMALATGWVERFPSGLLVGSGDVLLVFDPAGVEWDRPGVTGIAMRQPPEVGAQHGVYVFGPDGLVYSFLQKPSLAEMEESGGILADGQVAVDSGLLRFDASVASALTQLVWEDDAPSLDLYSHLTLALTRQWTPGSTAPRLHREVACLMQGVPFSCGLVDGEFTHVGTTTLFRHLLTEETDFLRLFTSQQRLGAAEQPGLESSGVVIDSALAGGEVGLGAVVIECQLEHPIRAARGSVVHGLSGLGVAVEVPEDAVVHQVPVVTEDGVGHRCVIRVYGVADNPKEALDADAATWLGKPLGGMLEALAMTVEDVWPGVVASERSLWNALLFPVTHPPDAWSAAKWMMGLGVDFTAERWRALPRMSLASSSASADHSAMLEAQSSRVVGQWRKAAVQLALDGADIRPMLAQAPGLKALSAVARQLESLSSATTQSSPAASLAFQSSMFFAQAGLEAEAESTRDRAFSLITQAVRAAQPPVTFPSIQRWHLRGVSVSAPVRIDFGGGWSDTPPFCLDWGGTVLNAAVALNGDYPIETRVRMIDEHVVRCLSPESDKAAEYATASDVFAPPHPGDPYAIPRAALQMSGLFLENGHLPSRLRALGGGLEISTSVRLPMGSGLGTSSVLAATVIQSIAEMSGCRLSAQTLSDLVLQLEQFMSTGGGWQDQAGGIFPGVKLLSTGPGPVQCVRYQPLQWSLEREAELQRLTVLAYTGIARVAKNLLQQVVGRYLARETATVQVLHSIKTLALEMAHAMQDGEWDHLGHLLDRHWQLNQVLDPNTTNAPIERLLANVRPFVRGAKLAGAGGGGFLMLLARSEDDAARLRSTLDAYDWQIARDGLRVKRLSR